MQSHRVNGPPFRLHCRDRIDIVQVAILAATTLTKSTWGSRRDDPSARICVKIWPTISRAVGLPRRRACEKLMTFPAVFDKIVSLIPHRPPSYTFVFRLGEYILVEPQPASEPAKISVGSHTDGNGCQPAGALSTQ